MAGVTDPPFRILCKEQGADLLYTEMVSAKGMHYRSKNTEALLETKDVERPIAIQIFGEDPEIMSETAKRLEERPFDILDINMGCPVPKVVNNGEGSALMKNPKRIGEIVQKVAGATVKPVTVKLRKGFHAGECTAPEAAYIAQESGAAAVAIHGRTREQYYSGQADWEVIRLVKERVRIPVIGNGDIFSAQDAERMIQETGCDMVMVGRAARGNPWLFAQIKAYLEDGTLLSKPGWEERRAMMLRHATDLCAYKSERTAIPEMRKHIAWYTAGIPHSAHLRAAMNEINTMNELTELLMNATENNMKSME